MNDKMYLNYEAVERQCLSIARDLAHEDWNVDYVVGLTRGGLLPANLLSQWLDVPMFSLDVSLRDAEAEPTSNAWMAADAIEGKNILIVDDINDSGATLQWIARDWQSMARPDSAEWLRVFGGNVRIAVLVNNEASKFTQISYSGMEINKADQDVWVVFPWEEWWGSF